MRNYKFTVIIFILLSLSLIPLPAFANRETIPMQEVDLYSLGSAAGIYVAPGDTIFVLDQADEIWQVDSETGNYQGFFGISGYDLYDISIENENRVWWTDYSQMFGSLDFTSGQVKYWEIMVENDDYWANMAQLGPLVYEDGILWLSEWQGQYFGFLRFDTSNGQICSYKVPVSSADILLNENYLFALDTKLDLDALLRLDILSGQLVKYSFDEQIGLDANLQTDGSLLWWSEDVEGGDIISFDPMTGVRTVYDLPADQHPRHLSLRGGKIWYTNVNGTFGRLDPAEKVGVTSTLNPVIIKSSIDPICANLGAGETFPASLDAPVIDWADITSTRTDIDASILSYSLPEDAVPFGIAITQADVWLSDAGRQKLIRMPIEDEPPPDDNAIFLPLIIK